MSEAHRTLVSSWAAAAAFGRGLAEPFHRTGDKVVIAGRRQSALDEVTGANSGMASLVLDIEHADAIKAAADHLKANFPALNAVIHSAGIMRPETTASGATADAEAMVSTNLLGPIRLTAAPPVFGEESVSAITDSMLRPQT